MQVGVCINIGKCFFRVFILKSTERAKILLKNGTRDFQNDPPFERSACFYGTISESFEYF